jgi:hypothetical protein
VTGAHQEAIDAEPGRVAQRFELRRSFFEFHGSINCVNDRNRQVVFRKIWKKSSGPMVAREGALRPRSRLASASGIDQVEILMDQHEWRAVFSGASAEDHAFRKATSPL